MASDYNPIFERIFARVESDGDQIIAYIAYGLYKERKTAFLVNRSNELSGPVPLEEVQTFVRTYDEGQIDLIWEAAKDSLATFAINYADAERKEAVRAALAEALRGSFWKNVAVTTAANFIFIIAITFLYFLLRIIGVDLLDRLRQLEQLFS